MFRMPPSAPHSEPTQVGALKLRARLYPELSARAASEDDAVM